MRARLGPPLRAAPGLAPAPAHRRQLAGGQAPLPYTAVHSGAARRPPGHSLV